MTKTEATKALAGAVEILGACADTVRVLHDTLLKFRQRSPDAQADPEFDSAVELLKLMAESIPVQLAAAILRGKDAREGASQRPPMTATVH